MNFGAFIGGLGEGFQSAQDQAMKQQKQQSDIAYQQALMQNLQARQKLDEGKDVRDQQTHAVNMQILGIEAAHGDAKAQASIDSLKQQTATAKSQADFDDVRTAAAKAADPYNQRILAAQAQGTEFTNNPTRLQENDTLAYNQAMAGIAREKQQTATAVLQGQVYSAELPGTQFNNSPAELQRKASQDAALFRSEKDLRDQQRSTSSTDETIKQLNAILQNQLPANQYIKATQAFYAAKTPEDKASAKQDMDAALNDINVISKAQHTPTVDEQIWGAIPEKDRPLTAKTIYGTLPRASTAGNPQANQVALKMLKYTEDSLKEVDAARKSKTPAQAAIIEKERVDAFNKAMGTNATTLADAYGIAYHSSQETMNGADIQAMIGGAGTIPAPRGAAPTVYPSSFNGMGSPAPTSFNDTPVPGTQGFGNFLPPSIAEPMNAVGRGIGGAPSKIKDYISHILSMIGPGSAGTF